MCVCVRKEGDNYIYVIAVSSPPSAAGRPEGELIRFSRPAPPGKF